jgi:hypothetical protein
MTDRPIIFSGPMVKALIAGSKTQTRRILKKGCPASRNLILPDGPNKGAVQMDYATGDRLYVREAIDKVSEPGSVFYRADYDAAYPGGSSGLGWRPSIHMPRWASRLTLTVTDARVDRLHEINESDAKAEGIMQVGDGLFDYHDHAEIRFKTAKAAFRDLWNSIHGPEAWDANPWVSAISFDVQHGNIDALGAPK